MIYTDGVHLVADTEDELHVFAKSIGLKRKWFQDHRRRHYDLTTQRMTKKAIEHGAILKTTKEIIQILRSMDKAKLSNAEYLKQSSPEEQERVRRLIIDAVNRRKLKMKSLDDTNFKTDVADPITGRVFHVEMVMPRNKQ